jgi:hypothetical protein
MWLTDLLPTQPESPAESAPHSVANGKSTDDPARQSGPVACRQRLAPSSLAGGLNLVIDLETGQTWYEPLNGDGKEPGKRIYATSEQGHNR